MNFSRKLVCRTCACLKSEQELKNIFGTAEAEIILITMFPLKIENNDALPKQICTDCYKKTRDTYEFLQQCLGSENQIRHNMSAKNKNKKKQKDLNTINETQYENTPDNSLFNQGHVSSTKFLFEIPTCKPFSQNGSEMERRLDFHNSVLCDIPFVPTSNPIVTDLDMDTSIEESSGMKDNNEKTLVTLKRIPSKKQYKCIYQSCNVKFDTKLLRRKHLEEHLNGSNLVKTKSNWKCKHCEEFFQTPNQLLQHEKTHLTPLLYECYLCQKKFKSRVNLQAHQALHQPKNNYKCSTCNEEFTHISTLYVHQVIHQAKPAQVS